MKSKIVFMFVFVLSIVFAASGLSFAQLVISNSGANSQAVGQGGNSSVIVNPANPQANLLLQQNSPSPSSEMGRLFVNSVQPFQAGLIPYLGPWKAGYNILENLNSLPKCITRCDAMSLYQGGVKLRINPFWIKNKVTTDVCALFDTLPMRPLLDENGIQKTDPVLDEKGKPVLDEKGKPKTVKLFVLDESKFIRRAYFFLNGEGESNTIDVIAKASIASMDLGADGMVLLKEVPGTKVKATGWGAGLGGVRGNISGEGKDIATTYSGGAGYSSATAGPKWEEGMILLAIELVRYESVYDPVTKTNIKKPLPRYQR